MWFLDQSVNRLYCRSQLYPITAEQEELSDVTWNVRVNSSPVRKVIGSSAVLVIMELQVPSNKWSLIRVIDFVLILILDKKSESKKESEEPELRRVGRDNNFRMVRQMVKESGSKRVDTLSWTNFATRSRSTQSSACEVALWGLRTIFLKPQTPSAQPWRCGPWPQLPCCSQQQCVLVFHSRNKVPL
jgi:hypothetical protein